MPSDRLLPPTYLLLSLILMVALHFLLPISQIIPLPWNLSGLLPLTLGIALSVIAENRFHKAGTPVRPGMESTVLVVDGPFRFSRNPMYLGFVIVLIGIALLLGSLTPFVVIPVFLILIDQRFIRMEEQILRAKFGATWDAYAKATRRWL